MKGDCQIGDLVHIPQAVTLIDCDVVAGNPAQMTIPLRVEETDSPKVGVITALLSGHDYVRVYCEGSTWIVKNENLYSLNQER